MRAEFISRRESLSKIFTKEHEAFINGPDVQGKFPGYTVSQYLDQVTATVGWAHLVFPIDMADYPSDPKGNEKFIADLDYATQNYRHVRIKNAVCRTPAGDIMEDIGQFSRVHAGIASLFKTPDRECFVHLIGDKLNPFPHPSLMAQIGEGCDCNFTLSGGYTVPGEPASEIDFVIRPIDRSKGIPAVTTCIMCGYLSNFHAMPPGLTACKMGCNMAVCPAEFGNVTLLSAEHFLHLFKSVVWQCNACYRLDHKDVTPAQCALLRKAVGSTDLGEDAVYAMGCAVVDKIKTIDAPTAAGVSKIAKALARVLPIKPKYFKTAGGLAVKGCANLSVEDLVKLGVMPLIQAACLMARLSGTDELSVSLRQRVKLGSGTFYCFGEIEGGIHGAVKSKTGDTLFSGDFIDWDWGAAGCTRNMAEVTGLEHKTKLPFSHLGRGVSLVYGAMCADKDTMDYLGLAEPLTFENSQTTSALLVDMIWTRIAAGATCA